MELKTYRAATMADCLAEVKKDLGKEAVILHTKSYRVGGVMGVGARQVVEITARPGEPAPSPRPSRPEPRPQRAPEPAAFVPARFDQQAQAGADAAPVPRVRTADPASIAPRPVQPVAAQPVASQPAQPESRRLATPVRLAPQDDAARDTLAAELASIKSLVSQVLLVSRKAAAHAHRAGEPSAAGAVLAHGGLPGPLFELYSRLIDQELEGELADRLVTLLREDLSAQEQLDESIVRQAAVRSLAELTPCVGSVSGAGVQPDGRPLTVALVGPTGVGKTTTVAKLAAAYKLRQGKRVGLITSDTYRIAAVDQLRTYASIIGLPLKVVLTPQETAAAWNTLAHECDVILIDSAGRSQHDSSRIDELRRFVDAVRPHETHLVLAATTGPGVMTHQARKFQPLGPSRVILSKLDEAVLLGPLVGALHRVGLRLSYLTTGQEVPDHIELASADRLARALLAGGWSA